MWENRERKRERERERETNECMYVDEQDLDGISMLPEGANSLVVCNAPTPLNYLHAGRIVLALANDMRVCNMTKRDKSAGANPALAQDVRFWR